MDHGTVARFNTLEEMVLATAEMIRPPERLNVAEAAVKYRILNTPQGYSGPYTHEKTPYAIEPMEEMTSLDFTGLIFVGPAQCAKTELGLNFLSYTAICDPADLMLLQPTQAASRDFAKRRVERMFRHSPEVGSRVLAGRQNQNIFDTKFTSGMLFTLSWPTISELSGKPIPRLWLSDYDRMPQNVDGEGAPFDLARKRTQTFRRYGMTVAESSPGFAVDNPRWVAATKHSAPPTKGILALYNRGDRRRWYWPCAGCGEAFEPDFSLLSYPDTADEMEAAEATVLFCPSCGFTHSHEPTKGSPGKQEMNSRGRWVGENQRMIDRKVVGPRIRSDIASFWLKGPAAAFSSWQELVLNYLKAAREYEQIGSEEALKTTVNVDQGLPYVPRAMLSGLLPEDLKASAKPNDIGVVPEGVRFLLATTDVQKNAFVVQVHGIGEKGDVWIIDRFEVRKSERLDGDSEHLWVSPGSYPEDWHLLVDQVILKTYELADGSGRHMQIRATACDSGGREGVTANAYSFWRWLRSAECKHPNLHRRFHLVRGDPSPSAQRWRITYPDSMRKDRHAGARGDVPVIAIGSNLMKDQVAHMLDRKDDGGGRVNFPSGLPDEFYEEMAAEERTAKGWLNPRRTRNESWDLLVYCMTLAVSQYVRLEQIDWENPPGWACEWDSNDLVFLPEAGRPFTTPESDAMKDLAKLAGVLG
jgi:phage terminase large subunit GpA-like protein